jgi:hypothetical protein
MMGHLLVNHRRSILYRLPVPETYTPHSPDTPHEPQQRGDPSAIQELPLLTDQRIKPPKGNEICSAYLGLANATM